MILLLPLAFTPSRIVAQAGPLHPGPEMLEPRAAHTATTLADGRVLIAGGYDEDLRVTRRTWVYGPG